jgi:hypothetical protein
MSLAMNKPFFYSMIGDETIQECSRERKCQSLKYTQTPRLQALNLFQEVFIRLGAPRVHLIRKRESAQSRVFETSEDLLTVLPMLLESPIISILLPHY